MQAPRGFQLHFLPFAGSPGFSAALHQCCLQAPQGFQLHYHGKLCTDQPGLLLVERLYNYTRQLHTHTRLAASGIRTAQGGRREGGAGRMRVPNAASGARTVCAMRPEGLRGWAA